MAWWVSFLFFLLPFLRHPPTRLLDLFETIVKGIGKQIPEWEIYILVSQQLIVYEAVDGIRMKVTPAGLRQFSKLLSDLGPRFYLFSKHVCQIC